MLALALYSAVFAACLAAAQGIADPALTGTWSSKSNSTFTGPKFYDPVNEKLFEPDHTGISYSFTDDGYYEVAYYRAVANPADPSCPQGIMQWQHGTFEKVSNGSLILTPFGVDGRQLLSNPCTYDNAILTRYNQSELFKRYEVVVDSYHKIQRLNLFQFNGAPLMPLYLAFNPPQMLPTSTLNPTNTPTAGASATAGSKTKRDMIDSTFRLPLNHNVINRRKEPAYAERWWWIGAAMTGLGSFLYFCF